MCGGGSCVWQTDKVQTDKMMMSAADWTAGDCFGHELAMISGYVVFWKAKVCGKFVDISRISDSVCRNRTPSLAARHTCAGLVHAGKSTVANIAGELLL